ncbi:MAG: type III pantothenate kinase [Ruminococcaceae bacterium]|nr:type III pantothenate kinase [Oscillospiraceae bacterium]
MILVGDIGNTSVSIGAYEGERLLFSSRMTTDKNKDCDGYKAEILDIFSRYGVSAEDFSGSIVSSVVPEVTEGVTGAFREITGTEPLTVGEKYNGNLKVEILPVSQLGADLVAAGVGAIKKYPLPCLVADLGTATKIIVIDEKGYFRGCTISPGVKISLDALAEKASLLPSISLEKPVKAIGENTVECMQSGIVLGTAAMLDGMISRIKAELGSSEATVVATGGYSREIVSCCETEVIHDENLLLDGLNAIYREAAL